MRDIEINIKYYKILIRDAAGGEEYEVRTLRNAQEVAIAIRMIEEDIVATKVEDAIMAIYGKNEDEENE